MAMMQTIVSQTGPLPISNQFTFEADGDVTVFISGSGWSGSGSATVGFIVYIDGTAVAECGVFTNEQASHKAMIPVMAPFNLAYAATHTVSLKPLDGTNTDVNDYFNVTIIM